MQYFVLIVEKNFLDTIVSKFPGKIDKFFECTGNVDVISDAFECLNQMGSEILIGVPQFKKKAKFYTLDINLGKKLLVAKEEIFNHQRIYINI